MVVSSSSNDFKCHIEPEVGYLFSNAAVPQLPLVPEHSGCLFLTSDSRLLMVIPNRTIITLKLFSFASSSFDIFYIVECQSMSPFFCIV